MNFVSAVAYHFCLNFPASFSQPENCLLVQPSTHAIFWNFIRHYKVLLKFTLYLMYPRLGDMCKSSATISEVCKPRKLQFLHKLLGSSEKFFGHNEWCQADKNATVMTMLEDIAVSVCEDSFHLFLFLIGLPFSTWTELNRKQCSRTPTAISTRLLLPLLFIQDEGWWKTP